MGGGILWTLLSVLWFGFPTNGLKPQPHTTLTGFTELRKKRPHKGALPHGGLLCLRFSQLSLKSRKHAPRSRNASGGACLQGRNRDYFSFRQTSLK